MTELTVLTAVGALEARLVRLLSAADGLVVVRRCADVAELLAVAAAGGGQVAFIGTDFAGLDAHVVHQLGAHGVAVVGTGTDRADDRERLQRWGIATTLVLVDGTTAAAVGQAARHAWAARQQDARAAQIRTPAPRTPEQSNVAPTMDRHGRMITVWGVGGAPGRSTTAIGLAQALARVGREVLLIDADTYGASLAQLLGVLDEAPGVAAACRSANAGTLDVTTLSGQAPLVAPGLRLLTGLTQPDRWPELNHTGLERLWQVARQLVDVVVVDVAACIEQDEELSYDTAAPQRNLATLSALSASDQVLALAGADPVGLARLPRVLAQLDLVVPGCEPDIVLNRMTDPEAVKLVTRHTGRPCLATLPRDHNACEAALLGGVGVVEQAPRSALSGAVRTLAGLVDPEASQLSGGGTNGWRRALRF